MNILMWTVAIIFVLVFFLTARSVVEFLCRGVAGFALVILYNAACNAFCLVPISVNLVTSYIAGIFGLPGIALLHFIMHT